MFFEGASPGLPLEETLRLAAESAERTPFGVPDGDVEAEVAGFFLSWWVRDRLGGDVQVTLDGDQTVLSAIASVKPA